MCKVQLHVVLSLQYRMIVTVFTCARELLGRRGKQQFIGHIPGPGTAGDARLLVAALHPV